MKSDCDQNNRIGKMLFWCLSEDQDGIQKNNKDNFHPPVESIFCDCCSMYQKAFSPKTFVKFGSSSSQKTFPTVFTAFLLHEI